MLSQGNHQFHMVDSSPWPAMSGLLALSLVSSLTIFFHYNCLYYFLLSLLLLLVTSSQWWRDVSREATNQGLHSFNVVFNMKWGMVLFILSEIMFFFSFFWTFFHSSLSPNIELGSSWPPVSITPFNPFQVPLLNTIILVSSGVTVTWSHYSLLKSNLSNAKMSLLLTIALGIYFTCLQGYEYLEAMFSIADSVFGAIFFVATGFHGLHVLIGSTLLLVMLIRMNNNHFSGEHHFGFEAAAWYWHFVDVVWLFLFSTIYWWGG